MSSTHVKGVLDLTFADIKEENDLQTALTSDRVAGVPLSTTMNSNSPDKTKKKSSLEEVKAIRIANNEISNVSILCNPLTSQLDTTKISWLDLSFNRIEKLDDSLFSTFPNVTTLYLQANQITKLTELKKLALFPQIRSLALYGNPVEEHKHYRNFVLFTCKNLKNFDMSPVTQTERDMNDIWSLTFRKKLFPGQED